MRKTTVAIIGGGFCGTLAAIRLLTAARRGGTSLPLGSRVVLIEPARPGQGLAYRRGPDFWRLNVPAGKNVRLRRAARRFPALGTRARFGSRRRRFPAACLVRRLPRRSPRTRPAAESALAAVRAHPRPCHGPFDVDDGIARIALRDGEILEADRVLLALGNSSIAGPVSGRRRRSRSPMPGTCAGSERLPTYVPRVLLVGTGLTMIDMALADRRAAAGHAHARDLAPWPAAAAARGRQAVTERQVRRCRRCLPAARCHSDCAGFARRSTRPAATGAPRCSVCARTMPALWRAAPRRCAAASCGTCAPGGTCTATACRARRSRGSIRSATGSGSRSTRGASSRRAASRTASWSPGGRAAVEAARGTRRRGRQRDGPGRRPAARRTCPLVQSLVEQGLCEPDGLGLGWETDPEGRLFDASGEASPVLYYVGPLLRARHWEAIAVPELRTHAARSTAAIAASLSSGAGSYSAASPRRSSAASSRSSKGDRHL